MLYVEMNVTRFGRCNCTSRLRFFPGPESLSVSQWSAYMLPCKTEAFSVNVLITTFQRRNKVIVLPTQRKSAHSSTMLKKILNEETNE